MLYAANRAGGDVEFENVTRNVTLKFPKVDITKPSDIQSLARIVEKEHGKVDVLFNNAGILLADSPKENIKKTLDTNFRGTLRVTKFKDLDLDNVWLTRFEKDVRRVHTTIEERWKDRQYYLYGLYSRSIPRSDSRANGQSGVEPGGQRPHDSSFPGKFLGAVMSFVLQEVQSG